MVAQQVLPAWHHGEALKLKRYTAKNLIELQAFQRPHWLEDGLRRGLAPVGLLADPHYEVPEDEVKGRCHCGDEGADRDRSKVDGPRTTCSPTDWSSGRVCRPSRAFKDDLIRLAHLLHVEVESNDTVPKLQKKVRPTVRLLMDKKAPATSTAMQPSSAPATLTEGTFSC